MDFTCRKWLSPLHCGTSTADPVLFIWESPKLITVGLATWGNLWGRGGEVHRKGKKNKKIKTAIGGGQKGEREGGREKQPTCRKVCSRSAAGSRPWWAWTPPGWSCRTRPTNPATHHANTNTHFISWAATASPHTVHAKGQRQNRCCTRKHCVSEFLSTAMQFG